MKRSNWKRTAAFVTSMAMSTTMLPGELSTVLVQSVNAADAYNAQMGIDWNANGVGKYLTEYSEDFEGTAHDFTMTTGFEKATVNADSNSVLTFKSKVPLKMTAPVPHKQLKDGAVAWKDGEGKTHYATKVNANVDSTYVVKYSLPDDYTVNGDYDEAGFDEDGYMATTEEVFTAKNFYVQDEDQDNEYDYQTVNFTGVAGNQERLITIEGEGETYVLTQDADISVEEIEGKSLYKFDDVSNNYVELSVENDLTAVNYKYVDTHEPIIGEVCGYNFDGVIYEQIARPHYYKVKGSEGKVYCREIAAPELGTDYHNAYTLEDGYVYQYGNEGVTTYVTTASDIDKVTFESAVYKEVDKKDAYEVDATAITLAPLTKDGKVVTKPTVAMLKDTQDVNIDSEYTGNYFVTKANDIYTYTVYVPGSATLTLEAVQQPVEFTYFKNDEDREKDSDAKAKATEENPYNDEFEWKIDTTDEDFTEQWEGMKIGDTLLSTMDGADADDVGYDGTNTLVISDTITVTNPLPFKIHINDNNNREDWINPDVTYDSTKGVFTSTFVMPASADPAKAVEIQLVKNVEEYKFTASGAKLTVSTKSNSIQNAVVAEINTKFYDDADDAKNILDKEDDKGTAVGSNVANGKFVAFTVTDVADSTLVEAVEPVLVTKDGVKFNPKKETIGGVDYYVIKDGDSAPKAGTYTISYKLKSKFQENNKYPEYTISKSFQIAAKNAIVAEDAELTITAKKNNVEINADEVVMDLTKTGETGATVEFMLEEGKSNEVKNANYQFTVDTQIQKLIARMTEDGIKLDANNDEVISDKEKADYETAKKNYYETEGFTSGSKLNTPYTFTVKVYDSEYGGSKTNPKTFTITWIVKDYNEGAKWNSLTNATVAIEDVDTLRETVFSKIAQNATAAAEKDNVTYKYIEGSGAGIAVSGEDELDEFKKGLPTKIGSYTAYAMWKGKVVSQIEVKISAHRLNLVPNEDDMTITYGSEFKLNSFKLTDNKGKEVTNITASDVTVKFGMPIYDDNGKITNNLAGNATEAQLTEQAGIEAEKLGLVKDSEMYNDYVTEYVQHAQGTLPVDQIGELNAGRYYITFSATSSDPENYAIASDVYVLEVEKKNLSDASVMILIDPYTYVDDNTAFDVVKDGKITARDTQTGKDLSDKLKITEGPKKATVGHNTVSVGLVTTEINYTGTVDKTWNVTYKENTLKLDHGLDWNEEMTTLYNNGKIHLEINRNANTKFKKNGQELKIKKFGVIGDNKERIAAPADYDDYTDKEIALAELHLQLGNSFDEGGYTDSTSYTAMGNTTYKLNYNVRKNAKGEMMGIWARPYILLEDNTVIYGDVKYLDLNKEAVEKLQLSMPMGPDSNDDNVADFAAMRKATVEKNNPKWSDEKVIAATKGGYDIERNRYYAYATFVDLETAGFGDVLEVEDFGVVLDNKGIIAAGDDVDKKLRIGGDSKLIVGHYDKKNKVLKTNEYAANIKPSNSVTGIWVRPYVDLGNDLIIYGEPVYVSDVSSIIAARANAAVVPNITTAMQMKGEEGSKYETGSVLLEMSSADFITAKAALEALELEGATEFKIVKTGVVADKKDLLDRVEGKEEKVDLNAAYTKLILDAGFAQGELEGQTEILNNGYTGKITPNLALPLTARGYVTYSFKNADKETVEVTVYNAPTQFKYNSQAAPSKWVNANAD